MSELKPCPFCGGKASVFYSNNAFVHCDDCGAKGQIYPNDGGSADNTDRELAIKAWNTRPIEDALRSELDQLREQMRWIPVSESLPTCDIPEFGDSWCMDVFAVNMDGDQKPFMTQYDPQSGFETLEVTHWMYAEKLAQALPLPQPPEEA